MDRAQVGECECLDLQITLPLSNIGGGLQALLRFFETIPGSQSLPRENQGVGFETQGACESTALEAFPNVGLGFGRPCAAEAGQGQEPLRPAFFGGSVRRPGVAQERSSPCGVYDRRGPFDLGRTFFSIASWGAPAPLLFPS